MVWVHDAAAGAGLMLFLASAYILVHAVPLLMVG